MIKEKQGKRITYLCGAGHDKEQAALLKAHEAKKAKEALSEEAKTGKREE